MSRPKLHFQFAASLLALSALAPLAHGQDTPAPPPMPAAENAAAPVAPLPAAGLGSPEEQMAKILADQERARALVDSTSSMQTGAVPHAYPLERYSLLWERSPFDMTVVIADKVEIPDPFKDYALLGIMSVGDFKSASFFNKAENKSIFVSTEENSKKPFRLVSIEAGKDLASTVVRVSGSGQEGVIAYDPEVSKQRRASGGGGGGQGAPPPVQAANNPGGAGGNAPRQDAGVPNRGNRYPQTAPQATTANTANGARPSPQRPNTATTTTTTGAQGSGERRPRRRVIIPRQVPTQR